VGNCAIAANFVLHPVSDPVHDLMGKIGHFWYSLRRKQPVFLRENPGCPSRNRKPAYR
jgi:hypothetical protein